MSFSIDGRAVGPEDSVFVIAEAGVNHNGRLDLALELVRQARLAGADAVKFQTFRAESLVTRHAPKAPYQIASTGAGTQLEMLKRLELNGEAHAHLKSLCEELGLAFISTPYSPEDADFLFALGVPAFKLASAQLVEDGFVGHVARMGRPVILSTGMATLEETTHAVKVARDAGLRDLAVLQCTTQYPSPAAAANIRAMQTIRKACDVVVGYSDHTETPTAAIAAVALGASIIEKHFTLDRRLPGPDQSSSFDPGEFTRYVGLIREAESALGDGRKVPCEAEIPNLIPMRRSVVALRDIPRGTVLTSDMIGLRRPATGLAAARFDDCLGRRAAVDLVAGRHLDDSCVDWL